jgi:hypothetical protein
MILSKEYGIKFEDFYEIIFPFMYEILTDNSIIPVNFERILKKIFESFPSDMDKKDFGVTFIKVFRISEKNKSVIIQLPKNEIEKKIKILKNLISNY